MTEYKGCFLLFSSSDFRSDTFFKVQKEQRPDLSLCVALRLPVYCLHLSVMDLTLSLRCHWHWICRQQLVGNELPSQWQHGLQKFDLKENSRQRGEEIILACQNVSTSSRKFYNFTFHQIMIFFLIMNYTFQYMPIYLLSNVFIFFN